LQLKRDIMRGTLRKRRTFYVVIVVAMIFQATTVSAQHASDNPISSADDAYGLTLGLESVGLYGPSLVRGFNPQAAGNMQIDGLYFDQQGALSNRVIEDSTIKVGVSEIGYAFPAPTGIVDYDLRHVGGDVPSATIIASVGPDESRSVSIDGSLPLNGNTLVVPMGVSTGVSTQTTSYGPYPGYTSNVTSIGATPQWSPNDRIRVRAIIDWQEIANQKTFPLYFTAGDFLPPAISNKYLGQSWAEGRNVTLNLGGIVAAQLTKVWQLKAGVFRSINDYPVSYADEYVDIQPNGQSEHVVVGFPDQNTSSNSGEMRLTGAFVRGDWRQQIIFMVRGRDTRSHFGGEDTVDEGSAVIGTLVILPEPGFSYSALTYDHADLWSVGSAYHVSWYQRAEFEVGVQDENYRETVSAPGVANSDISAHLPRAYSNAAVVLAPQWTLYGGYTQGLEGSGTAPISATNSGAVLPAAKTWQIDSGIRYVVTSKFKIIAGVFELQKPYFNLDTTNVDRELGVQQARGVELSVAGEPIKHLHINIGALHGKVSIQGPNLAAEKVGPVAFGQPRFTYVANANFDLPWWTAASLDTSVTHFGAQPASVDNGVYAPAVTLVNLGGRYQFKAFGKNNSLRLQVQNLLASREWTTAYTPGLFQFPPPRTLFAYLTTDL
jgi:iron complex outermembrane recepter protein